MEKVDALIEALAEHISEKFHLAMLTAKVKLQKRQRLSQS